jgi:glutathione synthase/RimK-type ligase-like ATP-grasp enzyme
MIIYVVDGAGSKGWGRAVMAEGAARGHVCRTYERGEPVEPGWGFVRLAAEPRRLKEGRRTYHAMRRSGLIMVQDPAQIEYYDDKSAQFAIWGGLMPETWRFTDRQKAFSFAHKCPLPIVSKADVGASSRNVWVISDRRELMRHVKQLFGGGVRVQHCSFGALSRQRGYAIFQRFIPHEVTWRVNAIGNGRAVFRRYNYPGRSVAQTGNSEAVYDHEAVSDLLAYADSVFERIGTKWCAIDVLWDQEYGEWRLLETSLAWPWPGKGGDNPIFRTPFVWNEMWKCMFHQLEAGVWGERPSACTSGST